MFETAFSESLDGEDDNHSDASGAQSVPSAANAKDEQVRPPLLCCMRACTSYFCA
jgi:hypothetical protein